MSSAATAMTSTQNNLSLSDIAATNTFPKLGPRPDGGMGEDVEEQDIHQCLLSKMAMAVPSSKKPTTTTAPGSQFGKITIS